MVMVTGSSFRVLITQSCRARIPEQGDVSSDRTAVTLDAHTGYGPWLEVHVVVVTPVRFHRSVCLGIWGSQGPDV